MISLLIGIIWLVCASVLTFILKRRWRCVSVLSVHTHLFGIYLMSMCGVLYVAKGVVEMLK